MVVYTSGINRNILECKVGSHCQSYKGILVLIETYWNVKLANPCIKSGIQDVLIETYWNVKPVPDRECARSSESINRNILECKVTRSRRTLVTTIGINRNILKCKGICDSSGSSPISVLIETYWNVKDTCWFYRFKDNAY